MGGFGAGRGRGRGLGRGGRSRRRSVVGNRSGMICLFEEFFCGKGAGGARRYLWGLEGLC